MYRIYRELELNLRIKYRSRIKRDKPDALVVPSEINQVWSMDFMSDSLKNGRERRTLNVIDNFNRESLTIDVCISLPTTTRMVRSLHQIIEWRRKPWALRCGNGPKFMSHELVYSATKEHIAVLHIQLGKPPKNAYIERFNQTAIQE